MSIRWEVSKIGEDMTGKTTKYYPERSTMPEALQDFLEGVTDEEGRQIRGWIQTGRPVLGAMIETIQDTHQIDEDDD